MTATQATKNPHIITVEGKKYIGVTNQYIDPAHDARCGYCALQADKVCSKNFDALSVPCGDKNFNTHYFTYSTSPVDKINILAGLVNDLFQNNVQKPRNIVVDDLNQNTKRAEPKKVVRGLTLAEAQHHNVLFTKAAEISEEIRSIMNGDNPVVMLTDAARISRKYCVELKHVSYIYEAIQKANGIV